MKINKLAAFAAAFAIALAFILTPMISFADITLQPQSNVFPENSVALYTCDAEGEFAEFSWYVRYDGITYDLKDPNIVNAPWSSYTQSGFGVSNDGKSLHFDGIEKGLAGAVVYCMVDEGGVVTKSDEATVCIVDAGYPMPPMVTVPVGSTVEKGSELTLSCGITPLEGVEYTYTWYSTKDYDIATIIAIIGTENLTAITVPTDELGVTYYCCCVQAKKDGLSTFNYSNLITVKVVEKLEEVTPTEEPTEEPTATPEVTEAPTEEPTAEPTEAPTEKPAENTAAPQATEQPTEKPSEAQQDVKTLIIILIVLVSALILVVAVLVIVLLVKRR